MTALELATLPRTDQKEPHYSLEPCQGRGNRSLTQNTDHTLPRNELLNCPQESRRDQLQLFGPVLFVVFARPVGPVVCILPPFVRLWHPLYFCDMGAPPIVSHKKARESQSAQDATPRHCEEDIYIFARTHSASLFDIGTPNTEVKISRSSSISQTRR